MIYIISRHLLMRYPAGHKQQTRERIVRAASRRFRTRGSEGAVIGDLMGDLRLTHGGFYRHFASKEDLFVAAFELGLADVVARADKGIRAAAPGGELKAMIDAYLNIEHCDDVEGGCPVAALAVEIPRRPGKARGAMLRALREHVTRFQRYLPGQDDAERRLNTIALLSGMAGTLTLARAFADVEDRRRILDGAREFYLRAATK
jgi:TetR/AcrR family transcriptional regulator, transcriptional repressor for nem operon